MLCQQPGSSPEETDIGENVEISAVVTNTGECDGNCEVTLKINGAIIETKEILLVGGASEELGFTTTLDTAGKKIIDVNG